MSSRCRARVDREKDGFLEVALHHVLPPFAEKVEITLSTLRRSRVFGDLSLVLFIPATYPFAPPALYITKDDGSPVEHGVVHRGFVCYGLCKEHHKPVVSLTQFADWAQRLLDDEMPDILPCSRQLH